MGRRVLGQARGGLLRPQGGRTGIGLGEGEADQLLYGCAFLGGTLGKLVVEVFWKVDGALFHQESL